MWGESPPALVVEGRVREIFERKGDSGPERLVRIEANRVDARALPADGPRPAFPVPGESVYVHVPATTNRAAPPVENAQVRVALIPGEGGVWTLSRGEWFKPLEGEVATEVEPLPEANDLGLTLEPLDVEGRTALRVTSVERDGPAREAGLEVGDIIIGANRKPLENADQLNEPARSEQEIPLVVVDVNTGKTAEVTLRLSKRPAPPTDSVTANRPATEPEAKPSSPAPAKPSLGIVAEPIKLDQRTALRITRVDPGSPAQKAGLEVGDVLVKANGAAITGPEQLAAALRKGGPKLSLTVRDIRTGKDVPVEVNLGGPSAPTPLPSDFTPPTSETPAGRLGVVTELAFYDTEAAVRVTEVERGSPAAQAGLEPGTLILAADGKVVLHPNELGDAERKAKGTLRLTIVDKNGRKRELDVRLR